MGSTAFWHVVHHCTSSKGIDFFTNESAIHMNHPNIDHMNRWTQWWRVAFVLSAWFWFWSWRLSRENFGTWEGWRQHHLAFPFPQGRIMSPSHLPEHHPSQGICSMCIQCIQRWQATVAHSTDSWTDSCRLQPWHNHGRPKAHPCVVPPIVDPVLDKEHKLYSPKRKVAMHHERTMILLSLLLVRDWNLILLHCKAATKH